MDVEKAVLNMIANLQKNTGKTLEEWILILKENNDRKHGEMVKYLKETFGIGHGFANMIAHKAKGSDAGSVINKDKLVENQYVGKENLKPIYNELVKIIEVLGSDVEFIPKNAYISVKRKKQFAIIQPSTKTRLDLGLNIKNYDACGKLEISGSFNAMCTHRIRLENETDIDPNVSIWIKKAYDGAG
jgi:predicted transport protein